MLAESGIWKIRRFLRLTTHGIGREFKQPATSGPTRLRQEADLRSSSQLRKPIDGVIAVRNTPDALLQRQLK